MRVDEARTSASISGVSSENSRCCSNFATEEILLFFLAEGHRTHLAHADSGRPSCASSVER